MSGAALAAVTPASRATAPPPTEAEAEAIRKLLQRAQNIVLRNKAIVKQVANHQALAREWTDPDEIKGALQGDPALLLELNKNLNSLAKLLAQLPETVRAAIDAEQVPPP